MHARSISFGEICNIAQFEAHHVVRYASLPRDQSGLALAAGKQTILQQLIDGAQLREWQLAVDAVLVDDSRQDWSDRRAILKSVLPQLGHLAATALPDDLQFFATRLHARLERILARHTIFIMPQEGMMRGELPPDWEEIVGEELFNRLSSGLPLPFSFVRSGKLASGKEAMLDRLVRALQMRIAIEDVDLEQLRKPGPTLVCGPTGVGKSYIARMFAQRDYQHLPVEINMAAVAPELLESRLRGYIKGAFTGADEKRDGWYAKAKGVLFLDELQSASLVFQQQLLDVLTAVSNQVAISRMGQDDDREHFEVKTILAVNESLELLLASRRLREDFYFRMRNVLHIPALNERIRSKPRLLNILLASYRWRAAPLLPVAAEFDAAMLVPLFPEWSNGALAVLAAHQWPGNLRELERVACDVFWILDRSRSCRIEPSHVREVIGVFQVTSAVAPELSADTRQIIHSVERILQEHQFVIARALPDLKHYKVGSRPTLRAFLARHRAHLNAAVRSDSAVARLMKGSAWP